MTLLDTINILEAVASQQPSVMSIVENDVYRLNNCPNARYGVFAFQQREHSSGVSNVHTFNFTLFYVDRTLSDGSNEMEVQSTGVAVLEGIVRALVDMGLHVNDFGVRTFRQRFADECAGAYINVGITVLADSPCPDDWKIYSDCPRELIRGGEYLMIIK